MYLTHLECGLEGTHYRADQLQNLSEVGAPLLARYDLERISKLLHRDELRNRMPTMWRYRELMPIGQEDEIVSLGEGWTPLHRADRLGSWSGFSNLYLKDESVNPTGSFKARGLSAAVTAARARGAKSLAIPTAGNAGGALAAYATVCGLQAHVFMPLDTPEAFVIECQSFGANLELVNGLISDCGKIVSQRKQNEGWFDVSTLKEPYRIEGKKTMGYEIAEQLGWKLPDVIIYPTGGGTGLIGMWKAFEEMEQLGWIDDRRPRMVSVQAAGCAPIVRAFDEGKERAEMWSGAHTIASGLRVPAAVGDFLILRALRESSGIALAISDEEIVNRSRDLATYTGIFPAPEGGAVLAALLELKARDWIRSDESVVLFNTGSGYKYLEALRS